MQRPISRADGGSLMTVAVAVPLAHELPHTVLAAVLATPSADALAWWVPQLSVVAIGALMLLEAVKAMPPNDAWRRAALRATNPVLASMLILIVLGGWVLSPLAMSIVAVSVMVAFELAKSLPREHRYRQLADVFTRPLVGLAVGIVLLCGWQLAEIIGFVR